MANGTPSEDTADYIFEVYLIFHEMQMRTPHWIVFHYPNNHVSVRPNMARFLGSAATKKNRPFVLYLAMQSLSKPPQVGILLTGRI